MSIETAPARVLFAALGALMVAASAWLLARGPRTRAARLLAATGIFYGIRYPLWLFADDAPGTGSTAVATSAFNLVAAASLTALVLVAPRAVRREDRVPLAAATGLVVLLVAALGAVGSWGPWRATTVGVLWMAEAFALAFLALRAPDLARSSPRAARDAALMSSGLAFFVAYTAGAEAVRFAAGEQAPGGTAAIAVLAAIVLAATAWLAHAARTREAVGRRVAWLLLGLAAAGAASAAFLGREVEIDGGIVRLIGIGVFAYGVLTHQMLGIDVKAKWTLRQSTVAAAFVGVFFVVSETVQQFFAGSIGPYLGIAAAGALVFALAPLQRAAQGIADRALPEARSVDSLAAEERAALYRDLARSAWADGALSKDERAMLDAAQARLGLAGDEAMRIEQDAARHGDAEGT